MINLNNWIRKHKLKKPVYLNMLETYRRINMFHNGDIDSRMVLLAYPSEVKQSIEYGLLKPYSKVQPYCLSWYDLTEKGKNLISDLMNEITWNEKEMNNSTFNLN